MSGVHAMQDVYWSDVDEQTIRRVKLDGSTPAVLLDSRQGVGVVDGTKPGSLVVAEIFFGRPFVKRFALCYRTVVCPVCLSVCL